MAAEFLLLFIITYAFNYLCFTIITLPDLKGDAHFGAILYLYFINHVSLLYVASQPLFIRTWVHSWVFNLSYNSASIFTFYLLSYSQELNLAKLEL